MAEPPSKFLHSSPQRTTMGVPGGRRPDGCLLFESGTPRFSTLITPQALHDGRLLIPKSFARKYGRELPDRITFQVPSSTTWKVEVSNADGRFWFHNDGLKKFFQFYSLALGFTLLFQYDGTSLFSVFIFDAGGSEIQYPLPTAAADHPLKRERSNNCSPPPPKRNATTDYAQTSKGVKSEGWVSPDSWSIESNIGSTKEGSSWKNNSSDKPQTYGEPSNGARKMAASMNPWFKVTLSRRCEYSHITVPHNFAESYFKKNPQWLNLQVGAKSWCVKVSKSPGRRSYRMFGGWLNFATENSLKEGDVCCFELINEDDLVLRFSICSTTLQEKRMHA